MATPTQSADCAAKIDAAKPVISDIIACLREKEVEIAALSLPKEIIVISPVRCTSLPGDWEPYDRTEGRFVIGSGAGTDENGDTRNFRELQEGGEYAHTLADPEMPVHSHELPSMGDDDNTGGDHVQVGNSNPTRFGTISARSAGSGRPHNNIPPFIALNFCQRSG